MKKNIYYLRYVFFFLFFLIDLIIIEEEEEEERLMATPSSDIEIWYRGAPFFINFFHYLDLFDQIKDETIACMHIFLLGIYLRNRNFDLINVKNLFRIFIISSFILILD